MENESNELSASVIERMDTFESVNNLADWIADMLDCPITIEDSNHRLISYSSHEDNLDEARISTIIRRKVPDKVINSLWKSGMMQILFENDEPVVIPAIKEVGLGNRVAVSVRENNEILGFIWAHTNDKTLEEKELQLLKIAAKHVKKQLLQSRLRKRKNEDSYNNFFWQLLLGELSDEKKITRLARQFGIQLDGYLAIIVVEFANEHMAKIEKYAYYLAETLKQLEIVCKLFDQGQFILLVKSNQKEKMQELSRQFIRSFTEKISKQLDIQNVNASAGSIYRSPIHIKDSYKQALKVLDIKESLPKKLDKIFFYQELGVYQFIGELCEIRQRGFYQNEYIEKLRAYDKERQTELLPTLKKFLECDSNVSLAAKMMYIHTNTMNYRLKRIAEVSGMNLKNMNLKVTAYLDLLIDDMT
ncbi:helix-turn-helix domain-containing protein [Virgibacillus sp. 179-BFC.A HS]|uniref:Helix-turn-helix domain-containing protein n=1 Tax=Tigheibacillus jepli TaxID=3035914 RepID=A0ABU5CGH5_9BACI|nr:helix-turn-helix domain-containing protein [Virgibacillus sp. 179-BFC.A HS]MDY0405320.1 helix-turn-helix domain-containing protein [Virgibacillus sp. 179-BFC.A HS]